jgi:hypothetical protein
MGKLTGKLVKELIDDLGPQAAGGAFQKQSLAEIKAAQKMRLEDAYASSLTAKEKADALKKLKDTEKAWKSFDSAPAAEKEQFTKEIKGMLDIPEKGNLSGFSGNQPAPGAPATIPTGEYFSTNQQAYKSGIPNTAGTDAGAAGLVSNAIDSAKTGAKIGAGVLGVGAGVGAGVGLANAGDGFVNDYLTENQSIKGMQSKLQSTPPAPPLMRAKLEESAKPSAADLAAQAAADKAKQDAEDKLKKSKEFDPNTIVSAMNDYATTMAKLPESIRNSKEFKGGTESINKALEQLNRDYQIDQQSAKDKTEKAKNRAEWASIASMLAKNVVGYAAALNGVDPNAMAYQTTDWEKHIQGLNAELDMNLGHIRENMKLKVEGKLGEKKDLQGRMDDTFKSKMEALRAQMEGSKAKFEAGFKASEADKDRLNREALAAAEAERKAREAQTGTTTTRPKDIDSVLSALSKMGSISEMKQLALSQGLSPAEVEKAVAVAEKGWNDPDKLRAWVSKALQEDASKNPIVTTTGRAGQSGAPVVQSETVAMMKDGKQYNIPADKVEAAKSKGYTLQ